MVTNISGGARVGRGVVEGVAIDTASMLHHRLFNGNARRKSHSKLLVSSWATNRAKRTVVGFNAFFDRRTLVLANGLDSRAQTARGHGGHHGACPHAVCARDSKAFANARDIRRIGGARGDFCEMSSRRTR